MPSRPGKTDWPPDVLFCFQEIVDIVETDEEDLFGDPSIGIRVDVGLRAFVYC